jgi:hypothetical protein
MAAGSQEAPSPQTSWHNIAAGESTDVEWSNIEMIALKYLDKDA